MTLIMYILRSISGADPGFQVRGGAKIFGVFRVKNHDFMPTNHIFSSYRGRALGVSPPPPLGHQFRNLLTLIVENWSKFWY